MLGVRMGWLVDINAVGYMSTARKLNVMQWRREAASEEEIWSVPLRRDSYSRRAALVRPAAFSCDRLVGTATSADNQAHAYPLLKR